MTKFYRLFSFLVYLLLSTNLLCYQAKGQAECGAVVVMPATIPSVFSVGTAITPITFSASGGAANQTYVLTLQGAIAGLTFSNNILSGTPTTVSNGTFNIRATSAPNTCLGSRQYTFQVSPACITIPTLRLIPAALALDTLVKATVGIPYDQSFIANVLPGNNVFTYELSSGVIPAGLSFSSTAGGAFITGIPTAAASVSLVIRATANLNCTSAATSYKLVVRANTSTTNALANSIKVYPNPSSAEFNLDFGGLDISKAKLTIYDSQGKKVLASDVKSNTMNISLDKFANGIYMMEIETSKARMTKTLTKL